MNSMTRHDSGKGSGTIATRVERTLARNELHPSWRAFVRYCGEMQHGEIERLKIQDGLPVLAEVTKKKIKFA